MQFIYLSCAEFHLREIDNKLHFNLKRDEERDGKKCQQGLASELSEREGKCNDLIYGQKVLSRTMRKNPNLSAASPLKKPISQLLFQDFYVKLATRRVANICLDYSITVGKGTFID